MVDVKFRSEIQTYLGREPTITNSGATVTVSASGWDIAKTSKVFSSGKIYYEMTIGNVGGGVMVGICLPHATVYGKHLGQYNIEGISWQQNGNVYNTGMGAKGAGTFTTSDVLRFCVDLTNNRYWVAKGAGLWNNDAAADPVTNVNGGDLSTLFTNKKLFCIAISMNPASSSVTVNGGNYATFTYSVPSGFTAADSVSGTEMWNYSGVSYGTTLDAFNSGSNIYFNDPCWVQGLNSSGWSSVLSTKPLDSGKVYFEAYIASVNNFIDIGFGAFNTNMSYYLGVDNASVGYSPGGANGPGMVSGGSFYGDVRVGTIIRVAFDYPNKKIWVALGDGPWDNNVTHDPATNTGGGDMTTFIATARNNIVYPAVSTADYRDKTRVNFGALSNFVYDIPSGFTSVDAATPASVPTNLRVTASKLEYAGDLATTTARFSKVLIESSNNYSSIFRMTQIRAEVALQLATPAAPTGTQGYFVT